MKKAELTFGAILVPLDYIALIGAGLTAYVLRFQSSLTNIQPVLYEIPFNQYIAILLITALVWLVIFTWAGLYNIQGTRRIIQELRKVFLACSTGVLIIIILSFVDRDLFSSRFIILAAYGFSVLYVSIARVAIIAVERYLFRRGIGVHNVVLVGEGHTAKLISNELSIKKGLGLHVALHVERFTADAKEQIAELIQKGKVDEIIQTDPNVSKDESEAMYQFCDENHIVYKFAAALFDAQSSNVAIQPIAGIPVIEVQRTRLEGWGRIVKRFADIVGSLVLIIVTSPIMLIAAIAIVVDSGFPIFFSRRDDESLVRRVGQYGKTFFYFKFRTMKTGTDSQRYEEELQELNVRKGTPLVKIKDDPRITRAGHFLRKFSIDELPEFFLVLKGDMSLVGPRPHLPEEVERYEQHQKKVLNMKPGITGMAQISGRSDLDFVEEVRLDTFYMENWALWLDIVILLKTPFILVRKRKAL